MKSTLTLIFALFLVTSSLEGARAAALRGNVTVNSEFVRIGDLFAGAGEAAKVIVAGAPVPGKSEIYTSQRLQAIAREYRVNWLPASRYDRVTVMRNGHPINQEEVEGALKAALAAEGLPADYEVELANRDLSLFAAEGTDDPFTLESPRLNMRTGQFAAVLVVPTGEKSTDRMQLTGRVHSMVEVPVLAHRMKRGEVIDRDDVVIAAMRRDTVDRNAILDVARIVGKTPRRYLRAGAPLRGDDLRRPVVVTKGSPVMLIVRTNRMVLTAKGRAMQDAAIGETLRVMNTRSKSTVEGVVNAPDQVTVTLPGSVR